VDFEKNEKWEDLRLRYTDFFQDHFYGIDKDFKLHIFKIDINYYIKVIKVNTIDLGIKVHSQDQLLDFKFIEDQLVISTGTVSGWENRIILNFFYFKDSITPVFSKKIELDPSLSPDPEDKLFYRFQSTRTNVFSSRYVFSPMLALKVKHYHLFDNVIFINPNLEYN